MAENATATWQPLMSIESERSWKTIAIILAITLGVVLIGTAVILAGVMKLGLSLL
jgi:hypothetical protein